jgi:hypothetical protein
VACGREVARLDGYCHLEVPLIQQMCVECLKMEPVGIVTSWGININ